MMFLLHRGSDLGHPHQDEQQIDAPAIWINEWHLPPTSARLVCCVPGNETISGMSIP
jgi:hypothetical protein